METITQSYPIHTPVREKIPATITSDISIQANKIITGKKQRFIRALIWLDVLWIALKMFKSPFIAFRKVKVLKAMRSRYRNEQALPKYIKAGKKYFVNFNTPGWPSAAFDRYVKHYFGRISKDPVSSIYTLVFGITKKCRFQCEHCFEWPNLNKPETLSKQDLLEVIRRFHGLGLAQVQLSGGEPLNRFNDIIYLLDRAPRGIDFWLYTSGYALTQQKAVTLKQHGLTGIIVSLDHHDESKHNSFRGVKDSYERALLAVGYAGNAGLVTCFSLCATKEFVNEENLYCYIELAKQNAVSFIQILEPRAVGHYEGKEVAISVEQQKILARFFDSFNYDPGYACYPAIAYHGYTSRQFGCAGAGVDFLYADTDGDIHSCTFCRQKLFSAFDGSLPDKIKQMKTNGCHAFSSCYTK